MLILSGAIVIDHKLVGEVYFGATNRTLFDSWQRSHHWGR